MANLSEKEILEQSKTAYAQWKAKWHAYAKINGDLFQKSGRKVSQLAYSGYGKQLIITAMGSSLEDHIETLRELQGNPKVDIAVVDKGFKALMERGIKPKYVFLADAGVSFDKWIGEWIEQTEDVTLISNITANPDWTTRWKGPVYFYVNKDNINTQDIFMEISGCRDMIPASSNVGNSVVVFSVQFFGYDEHLLIGYDFAWNGDGHYYAFEDNDKRYWMRQLQGIGIDGKLMYTSANLNFSLKWLRDFCNMAQARGIKVFNCSGQGAFEYRVHDLKKRLAKFEPRVMTKEVERSKHMAQSQRIKLFGDDIEKGLADIRAKGNIVGMDIAFIPARA